MSGYKAVLPEGASLPYPLAQPDGLLRGKILRHLTEADLATMTYVQDCLGCDCQKLIVQSAKGEGVEAWVFLPKFACPAETYEPWDFEAWVDQYGDEYAHAAKGYMQAFLHRPAIAARIPQILVRAGSALRAEQSAPTALRYRAKDQDVLVAETREPYAHFFAVEEIDVSYRRFDGGMSAQVTRAGFVSCDAVTVLPYDPIRDRVLVIEQFRTGPHLRGDAQPWQIEAIAGRIDSGETPEAAARRETFEEAGLQVQDLIPVAQYYPSPGMLSEFMYSYLALTDLPDGTAGVFGVEGEAEDIRGHVISFDHLMQLAATGELASGPALLTAYWLAANRQRLRAV
ncbi:MAG: NUDIX domain-containing protein [Cypionkella sp.]